MMRYRLVTVIAAAAALATLAVGCSSDSSGATSAPTTVGGTITVLAAASLQEAFTTLGQQFEAANPGTKVQFSFGGSSALAEQINSGAPADVFASASPTNMKQVVDAGGASTSTTFAKNVMEIAVPPSNPANVTSVSDLAKSTVKVALCQPQVPCGAVAVQVFQNAKISVTPVTLESDVKSTLSKVELNEVDAGLVYVTDVRSAGDQVLGIAIPDEINASTEYPIAALTDAPNAVGAQAFVGFVLSPAGRSVLTAVGFEVP